MGRELTWQGLSVSLIVMLTSHLGIIPGGCSVPILNKDKAGEVLMDFDSLKDAGSGLGTGAVIVMGKGTDIVESIARFSRVSVV